jgi:protein involved in polysaccharide export with SLBB domain
MRFRRPVRVWAVRVILFSCALVVWPGCFGSRNRPAPSTPASPLVFPEDRLGVDDVFEVRVFGEAELSGTYRVSADGTIDFPLAGRLKVAGLRSEEIQEIIVQKLQSGYLQNPQVSVMIKNWNSRKVNVLGQVQKPGSVDYFPGMTILDAIASAGGFTAIAEKNTVKLRREVGGKVENQIYPVSDISEGRSPNVTLLPGDVMVIEERLF